MMMTTTAIGRTKKKKRKKKKGAVGCRRDARTKGRKQGHETSVRNYSVRTTFKYPAPSRNKQSGSGNRKTEDREEKRADGGQKKGKSKESRLGRGGPRPRRI